MPKQVRVTPEDMQMSVATVDAHAGGVHAKQLEADSRMETAQQVCLLVQLPRLAPPSPSGRRTPRHCSGT